jgi:hypothetical protein
MNTIPGHHAQQKERDVGKLCKLRKGHEAGSYQAQSSLTALVNVPDLNQSDTARAALSAHDGGVDAGA